MNDGLIPNRYAKAIYKLALENGDCDETYEHLKMLVNRNFAVDEFKRVMRNPTIPDEDKGRMMALAIEVKPGSSIDKFIPLIIKNNRAEFVRKIALSYLKLYREQHNIARVSISTASQLPDKEIQDIVGIVQNMLKGYTLEVDTTVDPELIGGFTVTVGDLLLDASVKNELKKLRLKLLS